MKVDRLIAIIMLLINKESIKAKELAEYFEVSTRTIYRDIEAINQAGIPIVSFQGKEGGFAILDSYKIDRNFFNHNEMSSLITTLTDINKTIKDEKISNALEKISSVLTKEDLDSIQEKAQQTIIDIYPWGYTDEQKYKLEKIKDAIGGQNLLIFEYTNNKGIVSNRCIEPMVVIFKGTAWYLYGYCRTREDFRMFKISRINNLNIENEIFEKRKIDYNQSIWNYSSSKERKLENIVLKFSSSIRGRVMDQFETECIQYHDNGSIIVEVNYPEDEWVYGFILSFGGDVEVVKPPHIREIIKARAKKIFEIYV